MCPSLIMRRERITKYTGEYYNTKFELELRVASFFYREKGEASFFFLSRKEMPLKKHKANYMTKW